LGWTPAGDSRAVLDVSCSERPSIDPEVLVSETVSAAQDAFLRGRHQAVLVTIRRDGSPQTSNLSYLFDGETLRVSVTASRAKVANIRRDPRVVVHVLGDNFWTYASVQGEASLSAVTTEPGDPPGRELLAIYNAIAGPHPDDDEFLRDMVAQGRLVLTVRPKRVVSPGLG
jgi:PPOX class probable F420-dependent enzyme